MKENKTNFSLLEFLDENRFILRAILWAVAIVALLIGIMALKNSQDLKRVEASELLVQNDEIIEDGLTEEMSREIQDLLEQYITDYIAGNNIAEFFTEETREAIAKDVEQRIINNLNNSTSLSETQQKIIEQMISEQINKIDYSQLEQDFAAQLDALKTANEEEIKALENKLVSQLTTEINEAMASLLAELKANDQELSNKIDQVSRENESNIESLKNETESSISDLSSKTEDSINNLSDKTSTDINNLSDKTSTDISNLSDKTTSDINSLAKDTDDKISDLSDKTENSMTGLKELFGGLIDKLRGDTEKSISDLSQETNNSIDRLAGDTNDSINKLAGDTNDSINKLAGETNDSITKLSQDTDKAIAELDTKTSNALTLLQETLEAQCKDRYDELLALINANYKELTDKTDVTNSRISDPNNGEYFQYGFDKESGAAGYYINGQFKPF